MHGVAAVLMLLFGMFLGSLITYLLMRPDSEEEERSCVGMEAELGISAFGDNAELTPAYQAEVAQSFLSSQQE
jgi:NAD/NADP transhydrogenase alpha subunit